MCELLHAGFSIFYIYLEISNPYNASIKWIVIKLMFVSYSYVYWQELTCSDIAATCCYSFWWREQPQLTDEGWLERTLRRLNLCPFSIPASIFRGDSWFSEDVYQCSPSSWQDLEWFGRMAPGHACGGIILFRLINLVTPIFQVGKTIIEQCKKKKKSNQ